MKNTPTNNQKTAYAALYRNKDFRKHPELYPIGKGEQGVLIAEPYKSEILPLWRFKDEATAQASAEAIYAKFCMYKEQHDFVGMDMARKFLQMGFTRSRRYANHASGKKWDTHRTAILPLEIDTIKAASAKIFFSYYRKVLQDDYYRERKEQHKLLYANRVKL